MEVNDEFLTVREVCKLFGFSRATFFRMKADPKSGLAEIVLHIPPISGRIHVPRRAFEEWLRRPRRRRSRGLS